MPKKIKTDKWSVNYRTSEGEKTVTEEAKTAHAAGLKTIAKNKKWWHSLDILHIFHSSEVIDFEKDMRRRKIEADRKAGKLSKSFKLKETREGTIYREDN